MSNNRSTHEVLFFPTFDSKEATERIGFPPEYNVEPVVVIEQGDGMFDSLEGVGTGDNLLDLLQGPHLHRRIRVVSMMTMRWSWNLERIDTD